MNEEEKYRNERGPRIIFMGTPEFAVASLDALVNAEYNIVAVITAPDRPAGRGLKQTMSAVKKYALEHGLNILQPEKLKNPEFLSELKALNADVQVVVAFRMLPEVVWNMPPMGTINVHASLLPKYRGAAPINWAIIHGETETGVTTFKLTHEIDTGNILLQRRMPIHENDTAGEVHDKLKVAGAELLILTINGLLNRSITEKPQDMTHTTHAPKIFTETCRIDWTQPVKNIHDLVRGLSPFPGAFTEWEGKMLKIFRSEMLQHEPTMPPGTPETDNKKFLRFAGGDGYLYVKELQLEGKKKMLTEDFLRGYRRA
jgi:methionyl-tRNA formyltransferase